MDFPLPPRQAFILGTETAILDYAGAVEQTRQWVRASEQSPRLAAFANTHVVTLARHDPVFAAALRSFDLILPDGMPLVWVLNRWHHAQMRDRVYGPTFMLRCLEATQGEFAHFLLGGSEELLAALTEKLRAQFPRLEIAGRYAPPFGQWPAEEDERILARIAESGAQIVWIGLGCPKQELWMARNKERLPPAVYAAVGAAFAFHAGRVRQAPAWMQKRGLEWLFRFLAEPRRLWRRYVVYNSLFVFYLAGERWRGR